MHKTEATVQANYHKPNQESSQSSTRYVGVSNMDVNSIC
jgi:hypothetical protein